MAACPSSPDNVKPDCGDCGDGGGSDSDRQLHQFELRRFDDDGEGVEGQAYSSDGGVCGGAGQQGGFEYVGGQRALADIISAGARILESACGPCIGLGFSPAEGVASLRTFNRNFAGRSGTKDDKVYLVSPETAVASALTGKITDPRRLPELFGIKYPQDRAAG